jgi:hypothetical protein
MLFLVNACAADPTPPPFAQKLRECGFLSEDGRLPDGFDSFEDRDSRCFYACMIERSCADIREFLCSIYATPTSECMHTCLGTHICSDGEDIFAVQVCDGIVNCSDGGDEVDCPTFRCDDGEVVVAAARCNFVAECEDVSDEHGCPETEFCRDGNPFPSYGRCDGSPYCDDNTDEDGCPTFRCDDGTEIKAVDECDLHPHCPDGSDEDGCARLNRMCAE